MCKMKRKDLYIFKRFLQNLIQNSKKYKLNSQFLFTCLKNKKIILQQVQIFDSQFDPKQIQGYQEYLASQKEIYQNFIQQNKERIDKGQSKQLQYQLNLLFQKNRKQNFSKLFEELQKLNQQKLKFLQFEYQDVSKLKLFKISQFPEELDQFMQDFMKVFMDLIV